MQGNPLTQQDKCFLDRNCLFLVSAAISSKSQRSNLTIAIAPEGTRSLTGQLLPYKKGAFYMVEDLKCRVIPLLIYGAYDLYPVGTWVNSSGQITVS